MATVTRENPLVEGLERLPVHPTIMVLTAARWWKMSKPFPNGLTSSP